MRKIINYPPTIEECHDVIRILVAELNAERDLKKWKNDTKGCFPLADDNKFITNSSDILKNSQSSGERTRKSLYVLWIVLVECSGKCSHSG